MNADITGLISAWQGGDKQALEQLSPYVYDELRRLAGRAMGGENAGHTLQATALVHEAYMRLAGAELDLDDRRHFFALAARMMRRILVDHARAKRRVKRGSGQRHSTLDTSIVVDDHDEITVIELDDALSSLAENDAKLASAVELIYFGGMSVADAAKQLGVSSSTLYEDLKFAKAWVRNAMS